MSSLLWPAAPVFSPHIFQELLNQSDHLFRVLLIHRSLREYAPFFGRFVVLEILGHGGRPFSRRKVADVKNISSARVSVCPIAHFQGS